ncbi:c-type cytochrome biogenesis protein CcsB [Enemella evansiae]|uniref:c-type cytochrome biogenesis protein CcsB n=1 Tax=Enemella evansiae TaxID=2016499 RepID=UPI000B96C696|nr:c-type cytochrome biogenesis protein CcsB [Enemella evansiae]OYO09157.1 c-type cytochrome biogenesis protein CcsB [Enemella evansiae]
MDYSNYSMLAMVTAAVVYLLAVFAHAAEWASAKNASAPVVRRRRLRDRTLVTAGAGTEAGADPDTGSADTTATTDGPDGPVVNGETDKDRLRTDKFGRIGIALTVVALICNVVGVVFRGLAADRLPWGNMYEFSTTSMIFAVTAYLVAAMRFDMRWLGLPVTMFATIALGLAVTVFYVDIGPLQPSLHSVWFAFHILAATIAGAAFTVGGVASVLYLIRSRAEQRNEVIRGYLAKLPSAEKIDRVAYGLVAFAFPLFTFVICAGAIWAQYAWGRYWGWDPKETWSLVTWVIYACYLHARSTAGWKGKRAAIIALIGMASFWWNFVGINLLVSGLHSYAK